MIKDIKFIKSIYKIDQIPKDNFKEIILCGRSNVGKSSFINTLFNKTKLAKTSSTPGKTRSLNYYLVEEKFYIVDLPGYGYAKVKPQEQEYWKKMISEYINVNKKIAYAIQIIDSRHKPTELDLLLNHYLVNAGVPFYIVFNKIDKLNQSEKAQLKKNIKEYFPEQEISKQIFLFSAFSGAGKAEIIKLLNSLNLKD